MSYYYAYRAFIRSAPGLSVFTETKEELYKSAIQRLISDRRSDIKYHGLAYVLYKKEVTEDIHLFQVAKEQNFIKPKMEGDRIKEDSDIRHPYVHFLSSYKHQLILIEHNSEIFSEVKTTSVRIEKLINTHLAYYNLSVSLNEINDFQELEREISEYDIIEKIDMDYSPPNFFRGAKKMDDFVRDSHEDTNFESLKIVFANKIEGLAVNSSVAATYLKRLASGAGSYAITGIKDAVKHVIHSTRKHLKISIKDVDSLEKAQIEEHMNEISNLNEEE